MKILAVQNQSNNSKQMVNTQKIPSSVCLSKDLATDRFSKGEVSNNLSFKASESVKGSAIGLGLGIASAFVLTCLLPIAAPLTLTLVAPIATGGVIGAHVDKKIDEANAKKKKG